MSDSSCVASLAYTMTLSDGITAITNPPYDFDPVTRDFDLVTTNPDLTGT